MTDPTQHTHTHTHTHTQKKRPMACCLSRLCSTPRDRSHKHTNHKKKTEAANGALLVTNVLLARPALRPQRHFQGTQFTSFTSTKVQNTDARRYDTSKDLMIDSEKAGSTRIAAGSPGARTSSHRCAAKQKKISMSSMRANKRQATRAPQQVGLGPGPQVNQEKKNSG